MRDRFPLLLMTGLLLLGALGSFVMQGARRGAFADRLSTYRSETGGARGLYLLLEASGVPVERWQQDFAIVEPETTLVTLGTRFRDAADKKSTNPGRADGGFPWDDGDELSDEEKAELRERGLNAFRSPPIGEDETKALLEYVRNGGTLVYGPMDADENGVLTALDVFLERAEHRDELATLVPAQPSRFTAGVERLEARVRVWLDLPPGALALYVDEGAERAVVGLVPYGQGRVVIVGAPELAMNQALSRADNALFWRALTRPLGGKGPIAFDEYHHGFTGDRSIAEFAARYGLQFAAAQLLLGVMLWAGSLKRFGRPRPPPQDNRIGATDALFATSRLYREGRHHAHAASAIAKALAADFARKAGLPPRAEPAEISAALDARGTKELAAALLDVSRAAATAHGEAEVERVARLAALARRTLDASSKKGRTP
ncbi:MAG: hypothetical protein INH41_28905 [Myxococcaceae bacterium]|jgi:hypothetical protein|nr:hypothetical protein [Myxococcaceae bacterium]MCA3016421.1 hypothetical protein [Myxococcaceae bacterium]